MRAVSRRVRESPMQWPTSHADDSGDGVALRTSQQAGKPSACPFYPVAGYRMVHDQIRVEMGDFFAAPRFVLDLDGSSTNSWRG